IDLSPTNVLVDDDDRLRLIDFEAVQPIENVRRVMGTPGYQHPEPRATAERDACELDRFGFGALALMLLFPVHESVERHPPVLSHLQADLVELAPIEPQLWNRATRYYDHAQDSVLPGPQAIRDDLAGSLRWLAERTADSLEAMVEIDHPTRVYPTIPLGYQTNTRALAAGTAGVLYALQRAGRSCDPAVIGRLRDDSLAAISSTPPGMLFGSAGIAYVLAEFGEVEAAEQLLLAAAEHPQNSSVATFGSGAAGTAYGLLLHYQRTGEQRWLELAQRLVDGIADTDSELTAQLSKTNQSGLVGGRTGVALTLYQLHRANGDPRLFDWGMRLLQDELAFAEPMPVDGLGFKTALADRRVFPYLFAGSAGYASVLSRYLQHRPEAEFDGEVSAADTLERCLRVCTVRFAVFPGLFPGVAGLATTLAEVGRRLGRPELIDAGFTSARGLFRYAVPRDDGICWLGEPGQRLSADLWSGSAGILLALRQLTDPAPSPLDTLDVHSAAPRAIALTTP
ncbi:MAG: lanthionine synthetase C family protein, partial [Jatrophihabitantaceae bacterium]